MASACVNNIGMLPDNFLDCSSSSPFPSYGWFSPRISFSREVVVLEEEQESKALTPPPPELEPNESENDLCVSGIDVGDFEFRLEDPVKMLPADELFSDGKLVPLQLSSSRCNHHHHHHHHQGGGGGGGGGTWSSSSSNTNHETIQSPETVKIRRRVDEVADTDLYLFSPKAPRCSSRWKELLGLKKLQQNANKNESQKSSSLPSKNLNSSSSIKHFLQRNPKSSSSSSSIDSSLSLPLLRDSDSETVPNVSSGSSSSSSSSSSLTPNLEELPRFSIDSDPKFLYPISTNRNPPRVRLAKPRTTTTTTSENNHKPPFGDHHQTTRVATRSSMHRAAAPEQNQIPSRGVSIDSPRMNSSGKIVFQSLERSSSSPSTFNGGPRIKHRGVERSYSANVRVTPVLNVPVCSLRGSSKSGGSVFGFGQLFSSPQKRDGAAAAVMRTHTHTNNTSTSTSRSNRTDRN